MIQFSSQFRWWSEATFWYVLINLFMCVGFSIAVFIGGLFDLKFLLNALDEAEADPTDDGRVVTPPASESAPGEGAPPPHTES